MTIIARYKRDKPAEPAVEPIGYDASQSVLVPRPGLFPPPPPSRCRQLAAYRLSHPALPRPGWFFLGAHGGSGAGLLSEISKIELNTAIAERQPLTRVAPYGVDTGQMWPSPDMETCTTVVLVARTTLNGYTWLRDVTTQYLSGIAPQQLSVLGAVLIGDEPGKLPPPLQASEDLLTGVLHQIWRIPHIPEYRMWPGIAGSPPPVHPSVAETIAHIRSIL